MEKDEEEKKRGGGGCFRSAMEWLGMGGGMYGMSSTAGEKKIYIFEIF